MPAGNGSLASLQDHFDQMNLVIATPAPPTLGAQNLSGVRRNGAD
jgi:hypothetical protein